MLRRNNRVAIEHEETAMIRTGVIHGRFQLLHNDHLKYLLAGKARCEHLVVGITNPDPCLTKADAKFLLHGFICLLPC